MLDTIIKTLFKGRQLESNPQSARPYVYCGNQGYTKNKIKSMITVIHFLWTQNISVPTSLGLHLKNKH